MNYNLPKKDWKEFITAENEELVNDDAISLLEAILVYDHHDRITAKDALEHPYFDIIRKEPDRLF